MSSHRKSKRGLMVPWNFSPSEFSLYQTAIDENKISWCGNWEMWKPQGLPSKLQYIPQCRTAKEADQIGGYLDGYRAEGGGGLSGFVGFNEPDIASQANMDVGTAVDLWCRFVLPVKQKHRNFILGSPAISNAPEGIVWLDRFVRELGGMEKAMLDVVVIHYYSPNVEHFKQYVNEVHEKFRKPIWVNEFACTTFNPAAAPSEAQVIEFMKEALRFLDETPFVKRYAWFGSMAEVGPEVSMANCLEKDGGKSLSEAGKVYTTF